MHRKDLERIDTNTVTTVTSGEGRRRDLPGYYLSVLHIYLHISCVNKDPKQTNKQKAKPKAKSWYKLKRTFRKENVWSRIKDFILRAIHDLTQSHILLSSILEE